MYSYINLVLKIVKKNQTLPLQPCPLFVGNLIPTLPPGFSPSPHCSVLLFQYQQSFDWVDFLHGMGVDNAKKIEHFICFFIEDVSGNVFNGLL